MKSLVLFGDSLLAYCHRGEEKYLSAKLDGEYEIYNCATGGWDSNDLARKAPLISRLQPDMILISIGTNDASPWKQVDLETFKQNIMKVADTFGASKIIFMPAPPVTEEKLRQDKKIANGTMHEYNHAVIEMCRQRNLGYWDTWTDVLPLIGTEQDPHNEDGVHFSEEGYEYVLTRLAGVVKR